MAVRQPGSREAVSYTELEFAEATNAGLPRLVFLIESPTDVPADLIDADRAAIEAFRAQLHRAGLICVTFRTSDGLELAAFRP